MARGIEQKALIAVFLAVIWAPLLLMPFGWEPAGRWVGEEKRELAGYPDLGQGRRGLRDGMAEFDAWFKDRFGLRRTLILGNSLISYGMFGVSPTPKVMPGKNGWLFYAGSGDDGTPVADFRGVDPLSPLQLEWIRWMVQDQHDWLAERGIRYLFVIAPSKPEIYPEFLPRSATRVGTASLREQVVCHLADRAGQVPVLDLYPALVEAKTAGRCYHKTDTHWNAIGAMSASRAILCSIAARFPSVSPPSSHDFAVSLRRGRGGDLAALMALDNVMSEERVELAPVTPRRAAPTAVGDGEDVDIVASVPDPALPSAIVYRDSFANELIPFLSEQFRAVRFVWARTGADIAGMDTERPDIVVQIMVDRALRLDLKYSPHIQTEMLMRRFTASDTGLFRLDAGSNASQIRAAGSARVSVAPNGLVLDPGVNGKGWFELPALGHRGEVTLPIVKMRLDSPRSFALSVGGRNSRTGREYAERILLRKGTRDYYLALYDPELDGPLRIAFGSRACAFKLESLEVRAFPR